MDNTHNETEDQILNDLSGWAHWHDTKDDLTPPVTLTVAEAIELASNAFINNDQSDAHSGLESGWDQ
jgi:hypothetical protein